MKLFASAQIPSGGFYPVTCNKYFANKTPCTRSETHVAPCHEASVLVGPEPHKCRKIKRSYVCFLHVFDISWWRLHTEFSKEYRLESPCLSDATSLPGSAPHTLIPLGSPCFVCLDVCLPPPPRKSPPRRKRIIYVVQCYTRMSRTVPPTE